MISLLKTPFIQLGADTVSLAGAFTKGRANISGEPQDVIINMKLCLAVAQEAVGRLSAASLSGITNEILEQKVRALFERDGKYFVLDDPQEPFLQFPEARRALKAAPMLMYLPGCVYSENCPSINRGLIDRPATDAERIRAVLAAAVMPMGGRRIDKTFNLDPEDVTPRKPFAAPGLNRNGLLHFFIEGKTFLDTIRLNLLAEDELRSEPQYALGGIGTAPWTDRGIFTDPLKAETYRHSLMGRLLPMCRYGILDGEEYRGGIGLEPLPLPYVGACDPSVLIWPAKTGKTGWATLDPDDPQVDEFLVSRGAGLLHDADGKRIAAPVPLQLRLCMPRAEKDPAFVGVRMAGFGLANQMNVQYPTFSSRSRDTVLPMVTLADRPDVDWRLKSELLDKAEYMLRKSLENMRLALGASKDDSKAYPLRARLGYLSAISRSIKAAMKAKTVTEFNAAYEDHVTLLSDVYRQAAGGTAARSLLASAKARPFYKLPVLEPQELTHEN